MAKFIDKDTASTMKAEFKSTKKIPENGVKAHNVVCYFTVRLTNPNGDVDNEGRPRITPTGEGFVSAVCIKRWIRNVYMAHRGDVKGEEILVQSGVPREKAVIDTGEEVEVDLDKLAKSDPEIKKAAYQDVVSQILKKYIDARMFGVVLTTLNKNSFGDGKVCGPVVISPAISVEPVLAFDTTNNVSQVATIEESKKQNNTFGHTPYVNFGLYKFTISSNPARGADTGLTEDEFQKLLTLMEHLMFEENESANRMNIHMVKMVDFYQEGSVRTYPAGNIAECITCELKPGVKSPTKVSDYKFTLDISDLPECVKVIDRVSTVDCELITG